MKLGIFDSGIGGEAVAQYLRQEFTEATIIRVDDRKNVPYGDKTLEQVRALTDAAIQPLLTADCNIIILACNTATAAAIDFLRVKYPDQKFIGLEPMVKPAACLTKTGVIAICATPATLSSERYKKLKQRYGANVRIIEPDCSTWATMIEDNHINEVSMHDTIDEIREQNADVIVLACTHYHWIKDSIKAYAGGQIATINPSQSIASRVRALLYL